MELDMKAHKAKEGTSSDLWFKRLNLSKGAMKWSQDDLFAQQRYRCKRRPIWLGWAGEASTFGVSRSKALVT